jgi:membrane-bound lytic murein transglycosylase A
LKKIWLGLFCLTLFLLAGCAPNKMNMEDCKCEDQPEAKTKIEEKTQECNVVEVKEIDKDNENFIPYSQLRESGWYEVEFILNQDDLSAAWPAWINSCTTLIHQKPWKKACSAANSLGSASSEEIQNYLKTHFTLYKSWKDDGADTGLITGYYQPILKGSRTPSKKYSTPIYKTPVDLITVDLSELYPEMKFKRLRGKVEGNKLLPYFSREEISSNENLLKGNELFWVDNAVEAFFLEIQGSGIIELEDGSKIPIGYADQNGHPYRSMGRALINAGELTKDTASMQSIKAWANKNKKKLKAFLDKNPSFVFFRELESGLAGPIGAQGVSIIAERSIAIDRKYIPMGAPVLMATTFPNSKDTLNRLVIAQDTGGAIRGPIRADYYWGSGPEAGAKAGAMKQQGNIWVLLPKEFKLNKKKEQ